VQRSAKPKNPKFARRRL